MGFLFGSGGGNFQASGQGLGPNFLGQANQDVRTGEGQSQNLLNMLNSVNANAGPQQQLVAQTLQNIMSGTGPNIAQTQLANTTGQNMKNQAALMASQRGINQNPGLVSQLAAQQGAQAQQQAVGQAAALQAQQQMAAQQQLAQLSNQQLGQTLGAQNMYNTTALQTQNTLAGFQGEANRVNQAQAANNQKGLLGTILGGVGGLASGLGLFGAGGSASGMAGSAGSNIYGPSFFQAPQASGPSLFAHGGRILQEFHDRKVANGKSINAVVSPGEKYVSPEMVHKIKEGKADPTKVGMKIPGRAKVAGDSKKNDFIQAKLGVGGIVVPRTKAKDSDKTREFINAVLKMKAKA